VDFGWHHEQYKFQSAEHGVHGLGSASASELLQRSHGGEVMGAGDVLAIVLMLLPFAAMAAIIVGFFVYILYAPPLKHHLPDAGGKLSTTGHYLTEMVKRARGIND
jgi:hypothetical protein